MSKVSKVSMLYSPLFETVRELLEAGEGNCQRKKKKITGYTDNRYPLAEYSPIVEIGIV